MKKLLGTLLLLALLAASLITLISLYISGPAIKYDSELQEEIDAIKQNFDETFLTIERHVFRYVTYIGETEDGYYWFDKEGRLLLHKTKEQIHMEDAVNAAAQMHGLNNVKGSIGYGYENGAYILENEDYIVLLDLDTLEEIYYRRK